MAVINTILALVKVLLEIPADSNYSDTDLKTLITESFRSVKKDLQQIGVYFNVSSETITLTSSKQYTYTGAVKKIISLYKDDYEYNLITPDAWSTDQERVFWWDKTNKQLNFFRDPEYQSDFTLLFVTEDDSDGTDPLVDLDSDYNLLVALKSCMLIAASEKEKVDGLKEQYYDEMRKIEENASVGPRYVRQVENSSPEYGDI